MSTIRPTDAPDTALHEPAPAAEDGGARSMRSRVGKRLRRTPSTVWWITSLHLVVLLAYSILLPTYRSPDEPLHVELAHEFSEEWDYAAWDEAESSVGMRLSLGLMRFGEGSANLTVDQAVPKHERPSLEELEATAPAGTPTGINQLSQHPPLYYVTAGGAMWVAERVVGDPIGSFDFETWLYRLVSVLIVAPLPLVIWRTTRLLSLPRPVGFAAMLFPLAIPQFTHIASTVNNDSLSLMLFCAATPVVVRLANGEVGTRTAALAGVLTGLGLFTKMFAMVVVAWVAVGFLLALRRGGRDVLRPVLSGAAVFGLTSLAAGGWWWVRNLVLYGKLSPSRYSELVPTVEGVEVDLGTYVHAWGYHTVSRFWGEFGWYDTGLPGYVIAIATAVSLAAMAWAVIRRDRIAWTPVGTRLLLLLPLALLVVMQFQRGLSSHERTGQFPGLQGRYWFGAVAAMSVLVALGAANLLRSWVRWLPALVLACVAAMQAVALSAILGFYWAAPGSSIPTSLRSVVAWAPLPGELIGIGAVIGLVVVAGTTWQIACTAIRPEPVRAPHTT